MNKTAHKLPKNLRSRTHAMFVKLLQNSPIKCYVWYPNPAQIDRKDENFDYILLKGYLNSRQTALETQGWVEGEEKDVSLREFRNKLCKRSIVASWLVACVACSKEFYKASLKRASQSAFCTVKSKITVAIIFSYLSWNNSLKIRNS